MKLYTWDEMKKRSKLSAEEINRIEREAMEEIEQEIIARVGDKVVKLHGV